MARRSYNSKRIEWADRLRRHAGSGLSITAFCRKHSMSEALLEATKTLQDHFERLADLAKQRRQEIRKLKQRIVGLEVANRQLTNMLWGRRSDRRQTASESASTNEGPACSNGDRDDQLVDRRPPCYLAPSLARPTYHALTGRLQ